LHDRKENQEEMKQLLRKEYTNYNLVVCLESGRLFSTETICTALRGGYEKNTVFLKMLYSIILDTPASLKG
jgi:hypothetical protein